MDVNGKDKLQPIPDRMLVICTLHHGVLDLVRTGNGQSLSVFIHVIHSVDAACIEI